MMHRKGWTRLALTCVLTLSLGFPGSGEPKLAQASSVTVPLNQVPAALAVASPGDTILVESGTYLNTRITLTANPGIPITIRAETPGEVILTGNSHVTAQDSSNLAISGFFFNQTSQAGFIIDNSHHIEVSDNYFYRIGTSNYGGIIRIRNASSNNLIHHNTFDGNRSMGIVIRASTTEDIDNTDNEIYNNLFYNIPSVGSVYPGQTNGLEAIQLGQGASYALGQWVHEMNWGTLVYDNLFELVTGDGSEIISNKTSGNEFYRNTFLNNPSGLTIRLGESTKIYSNYFKNTSQGIRVFGYNHIIENNYIEGGAVGMHMPAAHYVTGGPSGPESGYYQLDQATIAGNVIVNPMNWAFFFGAGYNGASNRTLLPVDTSIVDNRVYVTTTSAKDFDKHGAITVPYDPLPDFSGNESFLASTVNQGNIAATNSNQIDYTYTTAPSIPTPASVTGVVPFTSKDPLTGASWRTP